VGRGPRARAPSDGERFRALLHVGRQRERFSLTAADAVSTEQPELLLLPKGVILRLTAADGVSFDASGSVTEWADGSFEEHHAVQPEPDSRPVWVSDAIGGRPAFRFDGQRRFFHVAGQPLVDQFCTIFAVVSDVGAPGHRENQSNRNGAEGNIGTSAFLGLTDENTVRFSDAYSTAGEITERGQPFVLSAVNSAEGASVWQNLVEISRRDQPLGDRRIDTPWVIGQQGNIDGEYWTGDIASILVFNRALSHGERSRVAAALMKHYGISSAIPATPTREPIDANAAAWASLCVVLFNSNEFLYVD
jgi:hypothetical protein